MLDNIYADEEVEYMEPELSLGEILNNYITSGEGGLLSVVRGLIYESDLGFEEANNLENFVQGQGDSAQAYATERKLLSMKISSWELRTSINLVCNYIDSHL